jgi:hypothetical protein
VAATFLVAVFTLNTSQNASHEDYRNSNFSKFWIAGHMVIGGLNPYDPSQWYGEHLRLGSTWTPDRIFLYPLPQAFLLVPLGLLPAAQAFLIWSFISQAILAAVCLLLLNSTGSPPKKRLVLPMVIFLLFFGPVYLSLQVGSIGVIALAVLVAAILLLDRHRSLLAGIVLSALILKPSQGLPILFLIGAWFLFQRDWKGLSGMFIGGAILLLSGLLYDPQWIQKFLSNSEVVSARTLGLQSNVFGFAYLACNRGVDCMWIFGSLAAIVILILGAYYLWRNRARLTTWQALNLIIPLGFVSAIYLWSYDQILYVIPIVWIASRLLDKTRSYLPVFLFLLALDVISFVALAAQAFTQQDLLSITTTLLVFGLCLWLLHEGRPAPVAAEAAAPEQTG